jgi:hypothetical protein
MTRLQGIVGGLVLAVALPAFAEDSGSVVLLKAYGIAPTVAGIAEYFDEFQPGAVSKARIERLIAALGSESFQERAAAERELLRVAHAAQDELTVASQSTDAEVRGRAKRVLARGDAVRGQLTLAVLEVMRKKRLHVGVDHLLEMIASPVREPMRIELVSTLAVAARQADEKRLRSAIEKGPTESRAAAVIALEASLREKSIPELEKRLEDNDDLVRVAAATALSHHRPRKCLTHFVKLLDSDVPKVRIRGCQMLRRLTGERFGFAGGSDNADSRAPAAKRWREWVETEGPAAQLNPLPRM